MLIQPDDAPEPILSTLKSLGEILTVHAGKHAARCKKHEEFYPQLNACFHSSRNNMGQGLSNLFGDVELESWSDLR